MPALSLLEPEVGELGKPDPPTEVELDYEEVDDGEDVPPEQLFSPKWYVNGFPKSGTHIGVSMLAPFARPMPPTQFHPRIWVGTFQHNSWTNEWADVRVMLYHLSNLQPGFFFKGHCGYTETIERHLWWSGIAMLFIYRDLRDVAVSQTHHILSDVKRWQHPDKDPYREMGFDKALEAVIVGAELNGVYYPGVVDRWQHYAGWLDVEWVLSIRYREARLEPLDTAKRIIEYGMGRLADIFHMRLIEPGNAFDETAQLMADASQDTEKSSTFRKGQVGGWREAFTQKHIKLFKESDKDGWLERLGYRWP